MITTPPNKPEAFSIPSCSGVGIDAPPTGQLEMHPEQQQFLIESLGQVIFNLDKDGKCSFLSNGWEELLGYSQPESLGVPFLSYVSNEHVQLFWIKFGSLLRGVNNNFKEQIQLEHKSGTKTWVRILAKSTRDDNNRVSGVFGTIENVDSKYNSELLLTESSEKLKTILNSSKEIILTLNLEKNLIENVNDAISLLGYKPEEWIGKNFKQWDDGQRNKFHELMKLAVKSELQVKNQQIVFANKNNTESIPFEFSTSLFFYKNEKLLLCVLRDIRERLAYEENIKTISTQLTHLINNIDDVYAIWDVKTNKYEFLSEKVEQLYGYEQKAFFDNGFLWKEVINKDDLKLVEEALERVIETTGKGEAFYRIITKTGDKKIIFEKVAVSKDEAGNADKIYIVKTDYTHVERAKHALIESEKKFRFISENISDFISIHDPDWNFSYASPSIKNILGYEPYELINKCGFDLMHREDLIRVMDDAIEVIVLEKKEAQFRYRMLAKDGTYKWVETYSKPVIDDKGDISSVISSTRDVSEQVMLLAELELSLEKERELNELRSMFVSTASHQFRTPLTVIQSGIELMEMYIEDLPEPKQHKFQRQFKKMQTEIERLEYLMNDVLVLGRADAARTPFRPETADLVVFCTDIIDNKYNNRYPEDRKVILSVKGEAVEVDFDTSLLSHSIENIISNAYKYSAVGQLQLQLNFGKEDVSLSITDQGIGIPEEEQKNLFQPFYRANNTNEIEGTGLGLSIVKEFIDKHSGKIFLDSVLNKGTTISVIIPLKQNKS